MLKYKRYFLLYILQLICFLTNAQLPVSKLGTEQGLSNDLVRSIHQDKRGFMWFGTTDGLNRYDGYEFKVFRNVFGDTNSLVHSAISGITEDSKGYIWLCTRKGVSVYNSLSGNFKTIQYLDADVNQVKRMDDVVVRVIDADKYNNILLGCELSGLYLCKNVDDVATLIQMRDDKNQLVNKYGVQALAVNDRGQTFVFVQDRGVFVLDYKNNRLNNLTRSVLSANCMIALGDSLLIGTNSGLYSYNYKEHTLNLLYRSSSGFLTEDKVVALSLDKANNLWIGTSGNGVCILNLLTKQKREIKGGDDRFSLSSNSVYAFCADSQNRMWVGTLKGGVLLFDSTRARFHTITHNPLDPGSLSANFVSCITESRDGALYIGTEGYGLNVGPKGATGFRKFYNMPGDANSISSNNISSIAEDAEGKIWVGTYTGGINRFDIASGKFIRYSLINRQSKNENKVVCRIYEDRNKNLWATTLRQGNFFGGLYLYNRQLDKFEQFGDDRLSDLFSIYEDSRGQLWGGNITQLVKIDVRNESVKSYEIGQFVRTIQEDSFGAFWIGTEGGGLIQFDRENSIIKNRYTTQNGLCNNNIFSILEDKLGCLWLSTFHGLSRFDSRKQIFKNFYYGDGLLNNQFHFNAGAKLLSGEFAFGGLGGLDLFIPEKIQDIRNAAPLYITNIKVNGVPVNVHPSLISGIADNEITALKVPFDEAAFSFDFAALEYSVPDKIRYAYMMDGWDKSWTQSENKRTATYTHLNEGRYVFKIKYTDADGNWTKKGISLHIIVLPPWYRSWWAYLLYFAIFVTLIYLYISYRSRQAKLKYEVNLQKVNLEKEKAEHEKHIAELEVERTQRAFEKEIADREREVNERRSSFFTNISHEFRTPLTLILNPIKDILSKKGLLPEKEDREVEIIYRNTRRMLSLTNQLLLFRREEIGLDKVYPVKIDLEALCKDVYLCFVQQAEAKNITYHFYCNENGIEIYADREKLEIVFYNLISNALKYTPDSGEISISIIAGENDVNIEVADNGPGIANGESDKIFDKFYQTKNEGLETKPGFGIGLYLAKQFTEAHFGAITCASRKEGGALFNVHLLKGMGWFTPEQLSHKIVSQSVLDGLVQDVEEKKDLPALEEVTEKTEQLIVSDKHSILVVDDDPEIRAYLKLIFSDLYRVHEAANAKDGITLAEKTLPDIIISDIMMEGADGIDLCRTIKANQALSYIPVILITGTSSEELKLQGVQEGASDYIIKPFDKELLLAKIKNLLKDKNSLQRYFYNEITLNNQDAKISDQDRELLENCIKLIENNLTEEEFNGKTLATELGMSYSSLTKKVKAISCQSLNNFIRFVRLRTAARLFINTNDNITEVATSVGIYDPSYFRDQFSKQFGMKPAEFIRKYRQPFANKHTLNRDVLTKERADRLSM